ncbi:hypothetical protein [Crocosphaera sp.]|uniref:hypothetical protein n=1 Tax=Crocosphaera sp. TaxID=2729996 RepID=UPI00257CC898|nr:hypothetical protein [Crocosphaera sp.]NQZ65013.1 hypothetical protein [Crocosphaera sp.]
MKNFINFLKSLRIEKITLKGPFPEVTITPTEDSDVSKIFSTIGSSCHHISGVVSTKSSPNHHNNNLFDETTVILGKKEVTKASWKIPMESKYIEGFERGYLTIAARRTFAGLHSKRCGAKVLIELNNKSVDTFELLIIPEGHTDYFHKNVKLTQTNIGEPLKHHTIYIWPITKEHLMTPSDQTITVTIEKDVYWDIDYVAIQSYLK